MTFDTITVTLRPPIAGIRLEAAVDARLLDDLDAAVAAISDDATVRVVLLTAAGGAFLGAAAPFDGTARAALPFRSLELMPQPVIAVMEGDAIGRGLELALACDMRIASDDAAFALPLEPLPRPLSHEERGDRSAMPSLGGTQRLTRLIGRGRAAELILLGGRIDAATALSYGLVNAVTPRGETLAHAERIAAAIASRGPIAVRYAKEAIARGLDMPLDQALRYETDLTIILQTTADRAEGVRAFLEKRRPKFEGR
jgi:enoyl-CoA hydratase